VTIQGLEYTPCAFTPTFNNRSALMKWVPSVRATNSLLREDLLKRPQGFDDIATVSSASAQESAHVGFDAVDAIDAIDAIDAPCAASRTSRGVGLWTRLVAIVLLPICGLLVWSGHSTIQLRQQTIRAEQVVLSMDRVGQYLQIRSAIEAERIPTSTISTIEKFGVSPAMVNILLGFDPVQEKVVAAEKADRAIAGANLDLREVARRLQAARDAFAQNEDQETVFARFDLVSKELTRLSEVELSKLNKSMFGFDGDRAVTNSSLALLATHEFSQRFAHATLSLFAVSSSDGENRPQRRELAADEALIQRSLQQIQRNAGPQTLAKYQQLVSDAAFRGANAAIQTKLLTPTENFVSDLAATAEVFRSMLQVGKQQSELLKVAASEAGETARKAARSSRSRLATSMYLVGGLSITSILVALIVTRRISRPLKDLASKAERIGQGVLDNAPLRERGARELTTVTRAVNELESIISTLDKQTSALALGELDNEVLNSPLPGRLGESVEATMDRLSASIRNREDLQLRLSHQASHDALTGLPNRKAVLEAIDGALARGHRRGEPVAVLFIDLDGFKRANDAHGHAVGDDVLRECGRRLTNQMRSGDVVGRLGGDEFVVVCEGVVDAGEAFHVAQRCIAVLSEPVIIHNKVCLIGASVGIAIDVDGIAEGADLLRDADLAVYRAKELGRGRAELFDESLRSEIDHRLALENAIPQAIERNEFYLAFQPILDNETDGATVLYGVEALIRWNRPGQGPASPAEFIPMLESSPRIIDIGRWVLETALQQLAAFRNEAGLVQLSMSVNIAARHLMSPSILEDVRLAIEKSGVPADRVVLEITETSLLDDMVIACQHLRKLRETGVRIAIDDFGTGFTSISQLGILPVDVLKIDGSFIRRIHEPMQRSISEMMIGIGATLGLTVVAEGVETDAEAAELFALGCRRHQGFLYDRPLEPAAIMERHKLKV
jgi:diguanylate cyclase (GGDEF)-like protein